MQNLTQTLANYIARTTYQDLPQPLIEKLKLLTLDTIGCGICGYHAPEISHLLKGIIEPAELGCGSTMIWELGECVPAITAVTANASMSHAVEMDDLHKPSKIHAGVVIVPTVLTLGSAWAKTGQDVLCAMAVGYETMIRVGIGVGTSSHRRRGFHATSTCGPFGSAAAVSKLLGLDETWTCNALGLAGTQAGGLHAYISDGSMCKRFHAGKAAQNGYQAAMLAQAGFTGPTLVLESPDGGFLHAMSDQYYPEQVVDALGTRYHTMDVGIKYHSCCGHIHQAIDAAIYLRNTYGFTPDDIEQITIDTYDISGVSWGFDHPPRNSVEGQFNFSYAVAVAIFDGQVFLPQFTMSRMGDTRVHELARRIQVHTKEEYTSRYPDQWISSVTVTLRDGTRLFRESVGAKGDPGTPLSFAEIKGKFLSLTEGALSKQRAQKISELVSDLENLPDISILTECLRKE